MRWLGTLLAVVLTSIAVPAVAVGDTAADCRQQWVDLDQLHGENGNPRGPVRALTGRWTATDDRAEEYAESATAEDCGPTIEAFFGVAEVDLRDKAAVRAFLRDARTIKRGSRHVQRMRPAYRVIGDAELDEE
ncbi:hypothetical protein GCM10027062_08520 [Nocardioides hungaricus]